jgi:voltage-gated potassium channel
MTPEEQIAADGGAGPRPAAELRDRFNDFVERHEVAWEITFAALAIVYVVTGFALDDPNAPGYLVVVDRLITVIFVAEFTIRIAASRDRWRYLREHIIDLVALIPLARGVRVLRLVRLLRVFGGTRRALLDVDRLAAHHGFGSLIIAWFGTMFICAWAFLLAEEATNPDVSEPADAIWWGLMTLTNGPTDVVATTTIGQWITVVMLVVGVALFGAMTAVLVSYFVSIDATADEVTELRALARMRDEALITEDEYESTRRAVLARFAEPREDRD